MSEYPPLPEDDVVPDPYKGKLSWWGWKEDLFRISLVGIGLVQIALLTILCLNQEQEFLIEPPQITVEINCQIDGTCALSSTDSTTTTVPSG